MNSPDCLSIVKEEILEEEERVLSYHINEEKDSLIAQWDDQKRYLNLKEETEEPENNEDCIISLPVNKNEERQNFQEDESEVREDISTLKEEYEEEQVLSYHINDDKGSLNSQWDDQKPCTSIKEETPERNKVATQADIPEKDLEHGHGGQHITQEVGPVAADNQPKHGGQEEKKLVTIATDNQCTHRVIQDGYVRPIKRWLEERYTNDWVFSNKDPWLMLVFRWWCPFEQVERVGKKVERDCITQAELTYWDNQKQKAIVMDSYELTYIDNYELRDCNFLSYIKPLKIEGHTFTVGLVFHTAEEVKKIKDPSNPKIPPKVCKKVTYTIGADEKVTKHAENTECKVIEDEDHMWVWEEDHNDDKAIAEIEVIQDGYVRPIKPWVEVSYTNDWIFHKKHPQLMLVFRWWCPFELIEHIRKKVKRDCITQAELTYWDNQKQKTIVMDSYELTYFYNYILYVEEITNYIMPLKIEGHTFTVGLVFHAAKEMKRKRESSNNNNISLKVCKKVTYTIGADEKVTKLAENTECKVLENVDHMWGWEEDHTDDKAITEKGSAGHLPEEE